MALTNWNDILNKPNGINEVPEIELTVEQLSASVLSIGDDVRELELSVAALSASVLTVKGDINTIESKLLRNCYKRFYPVSGGAHTINNIEQSDIIIFARNALGVAVITDNNSISWLIESTGISNVSYAPETKTFTFTRDSQYAGSVIVISSAQDLSQNREVIEEQAETKKKATKKK